MDEVKLIEVIYCTKKRRGEGVKNDPIRIVTEVFQKDGTLIAEYDPHKIYTTKNMIDFAITYSKSGIEEKDVYNLLERFTKTQP